MNQFEYRIRTNNVVYDRLCVDGEICTEMQITTKLTTFMFKQNHKVIHKKVATYD